MYLCPGLQFEHKSKLILCRAWPRVGSIATPVISDFGFPKAFPIISKYRDASAKHASICFFIRKERNRERDRRAKARKGTGTAGDGVEEADVESWMEGAMREAQEEADEDGDADDSDADVQMSGGEGSQDDSASDEEAASSDIDADEHMSTNPNHRPEHLFTCQPRRPPARGARSAGGWVRTECVSVRTAVLSTHALDKEGRTTVGMREPARRMCNESGRHGMKSKISRSSGSINKLSCHCPSARKKRTVIAHVLGGFEPPFISSTFGCRRTRVYLLKGSRLIPTKQPKPQDLVLCSGVRVAGNHECEFGLSPNPKPKSRSVKIRESVPVPFPIPVNNSVKSRKPFR
ncbi:hypothetical protein DFH08DRAFT_809908 [Mycena albidolilacea]|uniref:Uncharacterized protein n=1 Tax=Mycena albidolilacea TaxID=1033008 RepID=A0AAD6ZYK0_9AGAR|nr:hypothetical protein DFH08DRAFT_809908 [Mycena albidolilacea]